MKRKIALVVAIVLIGAAVFYIAGPKPEKPTYSTIIPEVPQNPDELVQFINEKERALNVRPNNDAEIVWANDSLHEKTAYAIVYLHGFGACKEEGSPVHTNIAKKYGCNMYLARLSEHGLVSDEPMMNLTATNLWNSALEAYAIGKQLGDKVILMSTSTGGTLSLKLAAEFPEIAALILYSPNIEVNNPSAWLLNNPWGLQIARKVIGGKEMVSEKEDNDSEKFWYAHYRLEAATQLQQLIETTMTPETFNKVQQPVLLLYYFKDDNNQDPVVKVSAMLTMFDELSTPAAQKIKHAIPEAGTHVIGNYIYSKDLTSVENYTDAFLSEVMKLPEVQ